MCTSVIDVIIKTSLLTSVTVVDLPRVGALFINGKPFTFKKCAAPSC